MRGVPVLYNDGYHTKREATALVLQGRFLHVIASEAIQRLRNVWPLDCFVAALLAMTI
jgi:hypothetical protein